jgi:hypothetical protein
MSSSSGGLAFCEQVLSPVCFVIEPITPATCYGYCLGRPSMSCHFTVNLCDPCQ